MMRILKVSALIDATIRFLQLVIEVLSIGRLEILPQIAGLNAACLPIDSADPYLQPRKRLSWLYFISS